MTEMEKLIELLNEKNISFEVVIQPWFNTPQVFVPNSNNPDGDIICHEGSYGGKCGLLETMGFGQDDVCGWLNADDALEIILSCYE